MIGEKFKCIFKVLSKNYVIFAIDKIQTNLLNIQPKMIDFTRLYDKNIDNLFAFGSRFTTDRELLKDCIHDVFVKFYTKREELKYVDNIESYLFISLRNRINDEYRRNAHLCDNEIFENTICLNDDIEDTPDSSYDLTDGDIEKLFDKLSPRQRQIINLYYIEQKKYNDICQIMGINYQSVRNLMHRSITRLREQVAKMQ